MSPRSDTASKTRALVALAIAFSVLGAPLAGATDTAPTTAAGEHDAAVVERARAAALEYARAHDFPAVLLAELAKPPLAVRPTRMPKHGPVTSYQWLGSGKGGGWYLHVFLGSDGAVAGATGGFAFE